VSMAYAPTTWDTNDVITKDKLNKIEQGINTASKLSGTDIDTDKNWNGKNITNVGRISVQQIETPTYDLIGDPAGPICYADYVTGAPSKNAKAVPNDRSGSVHVHYVYVANIYADTQTWLVRNGVEIIGTRKTNSGDSPTGVFTHDDHIEVEPGDVIGIREYAPDYTGEVRVFEIRAHRIPKCAGSTLW
jgi:hypothetical protein